MTKITVKLTFWDWTSNLKWFRRWSYLRFPSFDCFLFCFFFHNSIAMTNRTKYAEGKLKHREIAWTVPCLTTCNVRLHLTSNVLFPYQALTYFAIWQSMIIRLQWLVLLSHQGNLSFPVNNVLCLSACCSILDGLVRNFKTLWRHQCII